MRHRLSPFTTARYHSFKSNLLLLYNREPPCRLQTHLLEHARRNPDFKAAEADILKGRDPEWAYVYARAFCGDRWKAAEPLIRTDPKWACLYAMWVGVRWRALEHEFYNLPRFAEKYHKRFFSGIPFPRKDEAFCIGAYETPGGEDDLDNPG